MIRRALDWLANAKSVNDEVNADALRIAALELALRQANLKAIIWQTKAEDLQDKLTVAEAEIEDCRSLVAYARKRKASLAKHDAKRRGAK